MRSLLILTVTFIISAVCGQGPSVHFDLTSGDCGPNSTVVSQCNSLYRAVTDTAQAQGNFTTLLHCMLLTETLACVETALCHCNFSSTHPQLESGYHSSMLLHHVYNNLTQCPNTSLADSIEGEVMGPIDVKEGVNCSQYNRTAGDLALSLAVAQIPQVQNAESLCPGIQECYYQYDRGLEVALYRKNWPEYCQVSQDLLQCLVNASCQCGQSSHQDLLDLVNTERRIYINTCSLIKPSTIARQVTIVCTGPEICSWANPRYSCEEEYEAAKAASQNLSEFCQAESNLANCTEDLACRCGFYQNGLFYRYLAQAKRAYNNLTCDALSGPFPNHTNLNCGKDDRFTDDEKILTISLGEPAYVATEEARCPGIKNCYDTANAKSTVAHRMKDLDAICQTDSELITCVERVYCNCGLLNDQDVYYRLFQQRLNMGTLCYSVTGYPPITRCRGMSTCRLQSPLGVCQGEYTYDSSIDTSQLVQCQAAKNFITCAEEVSCACGLLRDGSQLVAEVVYNISTMSLKIYDEAGCPALTGPIFPDDDGIDCPAVPNDDKTQRRLALSYADSSEVAAMAEKCQTVRDCFKVDDKDRGHALVSRNYQQLCQVHSRLIGCVDQAYCQCGLNGTRNAEQYITTQTRSHQRLCSTVAVHTRKSCNKDTSRADVMGLSFILLTITLMTSATMTS